MNLWNCWHSSALPDQQLFFTACLPLPPVINRHPPSTHTRQTARVNAKMARYYAEAATYLAQARVHDFGLIISLQENRFRVPLIAHIKFYFAHNGEKEMEHLVTPIIRATLHFLNLNRNPIAELHIQRYIDINNPHAEIFLYYSY
jgi:hypothetical protein